MKRLCKLLILTVIIGYASFYGEGDGFAWKTMANGEPMNPSALTCASWHFPLGSRLEVSSGAKKIIVEVTDRGGYHLLDLSAGAFSRLAPKSRGIIKVKVRKIK